VGCSGLTVVFFRETKIVKGRREYRQHQQNERRKRPQWGRDRKEQAKKRCLNPEIADLSEEGRIQLRRRRRRSVAAVAKATIPKLAGSGTDVVMPSSEIDIAAAGPACTGRRG